MRVVRLGGEQVEERLRPGTVVAIRRDHLFPVENRSVGGPQRAHAVIVTDVLGWEPLPMRKWRNWQTRRI